MTFFKPSIFFRRLLVSSNGKTVYDESFHDGVCIIRGQNSHGKSTIVDFLFYGLGGEISEWKNMASRCDEIVVEVEINGETITLKREVNPKEARRPMSIFWGAMDSALKSAVGGWEMYPFRRSEKKQSFSQVLFKAMKMPEVRSDSDDNITMHQMLRLIYVDQISPPDFMFRVEKFDNTFIRKAAADLLCGTYDDTLINNQLELNAKKKKLEALKSEVRGVFDILARLQGTFEPERLQVELLELQKELKEISVQIEGDWSRLHPKKDGVDSNDKKLAELRNSIALSRGRMRTVSQGIEDLELKNEDSKLLIASLEKRLLAIDESETVRKGLGEFDFDFCPSCLRKLESETSKHSCNLCGKAFGDDEGSSILRMRQEIELQIIESKKLLEIRVEKIGELALQGKTEKRILDTLTARFDAELANVKTLRDNATEQLQKRTGFIDGRIQELLRLQKLAEGTEALQQRQVDLENEVVSLGNKIERSKSLQEKRASEVFLKIKTAVLTYLQRDTRESAFQHAGEFALDFLNGTVSVDGVNQFSASSMTLLKNIFHLALFEASLELTYMRYPRLLVIDRVEDGGMEPPRSQDFQRLVVATSEASEVRHQIIFTTSVIAPELDIPKYTIGKDYRDEVRTLDF